MEPLLLINLSTFKIALTRLAAFSGWTAWGMLPWAALFGVSLVVALIIRLITGAPADRTVMNIIRQVCEGLMLTALVVMVARPRRK